MMDHIKIYIDADEEVAEAVEEYRDYIMKETLTVEMVNGKDLAEVDLNGHKTGLAVERV